jgi:hypothetical protein
VDGTYVLASITYYGTCGSPPNDDRYVWSICGANWATAQESPLNPGSPDAGVFIAKINASVSTQDASLTLTITCDSSGALPAPQHWSYDATADALVVYLPQTGGGLRADAYRRQ